ncbi:MAG: sporulation initiation factor Spo0A C-terminal domain-containing protein [Clostridia bacterium]|nr:sporulation initiation factor Spo0A C-terminal domain-containing protein [Clostridia bacterium]
MRWLVAGSLDAMGEAWVTAVENEDERWRCTYTDEEDAAWAQIPTCDVLVLQYSALGQHLGERLTQTSIPTPPYLVCPGWHHPLQDSTRTLPEITVLAQEIRAMQQAGQLPRAADRLLPALACAAREQLLQLGMPPELRANDFLPDMLALCAAHPPLLRNVHGLLYPLIARRHGSNPARIERSLRLAIEVAWERAPLTALERSFGDPVDPERGKPTNAGFLWGLVRAGNLTGIPPQGGRLWQAKEPA